MERFFTGTGTHKIFVSVSVLLFIGWWALPAMAYYTIHPYRPLGISSLKKREYRTQRIPHRVNLNTASLEELKTLPGMSEDTALKMMRYRKQTPFQRMEDLYALPAHARPYMVQLSQRWKDMIRFQ